MNDDGFNDVFVGAPYHDDGQGAVFLYLGGPLGLQTTTSQVRYDQAGAGGFA